MKIFDEVEEDVEIDEVGQNPSTQRAKKWKMEAKSSERKDKRQAVTPYSLIQREVLVKNFNVYEDLQNAFDEFKFEIMKVRGDHSSVSDYTFIYRVKTEPIEDMIKKKTVHKLVIRSPFVI